MEEKNAQIIFKPYHSNKNTPHPPLPRPLNFHCNRFNLQFGISNSRHPNKARLSPIFPSGQNIHSSFEDINPTSQPEVPQIQQSSPTLYPRKQKISRMTDQPSHLSHSVQMDYVRSGFPIRKKKTGEQQFLKLLMKFANDSPRKILKNGQPLFDEEKELKTQKPKKKMRTTFNWTKKRYCVNRDKQQGMFRESANFSKFNQSFKHA